MSNPKRKKQTYRHIANAVSVTVYHPMGEEIPEEAIKEIEESVCKIAQNNRLLINIATT